ncbi:glycosyltransferase [Desertivirga brevis]|uniref:glycosyltransferase n=1 Tax=Desertivirga brevis TaxID=2810310 RepID=UPI001A9680BE|nr:glycosyltransferase [Pedobacter sp. SYSU D00873]
MRKLKVLFFPAWYPNHLNPIAGKFVRDHAKSINSDTHLAIYYVINDPSLNSLFQFKAGVEDGISVYRSYSLWINKSYMFPLNAILFMFASFYGYYKAYRMFGKADVNHVHVLTRSGIIPFFLKFLHQTPYVITEHWSRYLPERNTYKGLFRKFVTRIIVKHASGMSAVSEALKRAMIKQGLSHKDFRIINNAVDSNRFTLSPNYSQSKTNSFLHISGMEDHVKNIRGILGAAKIVKSKGRRFELHFVGHSKEIDEFKKIVCTEGLEQEVFFHGHIDKEIPEYFHQSSAFILFSHFENQPVVLIESLLCGVPVIGSMAGGIPEMISSDNGLLVSPANKDELAESMINFIDGTVDFNRDKIRSEALKKYGRAEVGAQLLKFYMDVILPH